MRTRRALLLRPGRVVGPTAGVRLMRLLRLACIPAATFATTATFTSRSLRAVLIRVTRTMFLRSLLLSRTLMRVFTQRRRSGLEVRDGGVRHLFADRLLDVPEQAVLIL